jgi:Outer membrane receptor proteins, mostly Fe transport
VSGRIVDETNQPVMGAGIQEKGTSNGTVSDLDGQFTLVTNADAVLVFTSLGYDTKEVAVNGNSVINVVLNSSSEFLEDVVVVGYGVQKKKLITGSTIQVKGDDIAKLNSTSALGALQSSTPGVNIIANTGQPGDGFNVNIRGMGTIGSYKPLYVIDGVAGGDISTLNPSDIESIDILKDAASAAIYGARAANGVILVTTKQGKEGNIQISYDGYVGWQNAPIIPEVLNAKQYIEVINTAEKNNQAHPTDFSAVLSPELYKSIMDGSFTGTNWIREFHNDNAPVSNHAVNLTGGTDRSKFSMGVSFTDQEGIFGKPAASNFKRATVRLNSDHVVLRKNDLDIITVGENVSFSYSEKSGINLSNQYSNNMFDALTANPLAPMRRADGEYTNADDYTAFGISSSTATPRTRCM